MKYFLSLLTLTLVCAATSVAQDTETVPDADPADVESVDAIIAAIYDVISGAAGEKRDWDRFRSLFRPEAKLIPTGLAQGGGFFVLYMSPEDYISRSGARLEATGFFETEIHRIQEGYGQVVHLFSTYESRRNLDDPDPFVRGINSFQLVNDGERWWIVNIFWQGENPNLVVPGKYLPKD